jgi:hypothetical protein
MTCYVYDVTNATVIATSNVNIPYGSGSQQITFDATTSNSYRLCFHVAGTGTSAWTYKFDNVKVGPQEAIVAPALGDWQSYTTTTGLTGGTTTFTAYYRRVGDSLEMSVIANFASVFTGGTATFTLPSGLTIDTTKFTATPTAGSTLLGHGTIYDASTGDSYPCEVLYQTTTTVIIRVHQDDFGTGSNYVTYSGLSTTIPMTWANGDLIQFTARMPIANWSSNIQLANSRVEYASNSGMTDAADTTSFVNDPNGSPIPATTYAAGRLKRVRFKNPIQASDTLELQIKQDNTYNTWVPAGNYFRAAQDVVNNVNVDTGATLYTPVNSTDVDVYFGRYANNTNNWSASNTSRWRVVKYSNAVPVEVQSHSYQESKNSSLTSWTTSGQYGDATSLTLQPGEYDLTASVTANLNGASMTTMTIGISTTSGNSGTGLAIDENRVDSTAFPTAAHNSSMVIPNYRVLVTAPTVYYLKIAATYTTATPKYSYRFSARRIN